MRKDYAKSLMNGDDWNLYAQKRKLDKVEPTGTMGKYVNVINFPIDAWTRRVNSAVTNVNEQVLIKRDMGQSTNTPANELLNRFGKTYNGEDEDEVIFLHVPQPSSSSALNMSPNQRQKGADDSSRGFLDLSIFRIILGVVHYRWGQNNAQLNRQPSELNEQRKGKNKHNGCTGQEHIQLEEDEERIENFLLAINARWFPLNLMEEFKQGKLLIERFFKYKREIATGSDGSKTWEEHTLLENEKEQLEKIFRKRNGTRPPSILVEDSREGNGHSIGKLFVSKREIAEGSNMTVIFEGIYDRNLHVAIKRVLRRRNVVALYNLCMLIKLVRHPSIVHVLDIGMDEDYIYFAMERCICNLYELIQLCSTNMNGDNALGGPITRIVKKLWKPNGYPSPELLKLIRDVVAGLARLHVLGFVNRDLKPQNVLISCEESLCAKICDQGMIRGIGKARRRSPGWHSPELLLGGNADVSGTPLWYRRWGPYELSELQAADLFNLGCVIFYFITKGRHPFGSDLQQDANIVENRPDLTLVKHIYEAAHLITNLLHPQPKMRPKAAKVLCHPFFWDSEKRGLYLRDVSIWLEHDDSNSDVVNAIMDVAPKVLIGNWDVKMESWFVTYATHQKYYSYDSVLDLMLLIGNTLSHQQRLPKDIKVLIGSTNGEIYEYFASRFPNLFIEVYDIINKYCEENVILILGKKNCEEEKALLMYWSW